MLLSPLATISEGMINTTDFLLSIVLEIQNHRDKDFVLHIGMATEIVLKVIDGKQNRNLSGIVALGRKILHDPDLKVNCTCVRVPVMRSHSIAVTLRTEKKIDIESAKKAVAAFPGVRLIEDYEGRCYPTPLDTTDQDLVWVGRIRQDLTDENGITLWCCGDQIRKGAASNAVQILKLLAEKD